MQIAVVGSNDFITGFQLAGVRSIYQTDSSNIEETIQKVIEDEEIGVMVLEEEEMQKLSHRARKSLDKLIKPVIVTLTTEPKKDDIRELIKRSVGIDLLKE